MKKLLSVALLFISYLTFSQQIKRKVVSDSISMGQVLVVNVNSQEKTYSDPDGGFLINANSGDEVRLVKLGFERKIIIMKNEKELRINLTKSAIEIEEVEVRKQLSGNLTKDSKLFDENRKKVTLNKDLKVYFKAKSSTEVLKEKPGEFVQPVSAGFGFGAIENKWTVTDLVEWIRKNWPDDYFISMGFQLPEINSFLYHALSNFNTDHILKYGFCDEKDIGNLKLHFEKELKNYKK